MKFLGQVVRKLEPEQDRHTHRQTDRHDLMHYDAAFATDNECLKNKTFL